MIEQPRNIWPVNAELGEGPSWIGDALWFVDIKKRKLHRCDARGGSRQSWDSPEQIGFVAPCRSGAFIAGLQSGLHSFDPDSGNFSLLVEVEPDKPGNRLNDAVVDPAGRLWFGTMDNGERDKSGAFYCFHRGKLHETGLNGISITNGPAISPDGKILYWVDTLGGGIFASDIGDDASLGPARPFARIAASEGHPDGPSVDCEGFVWIGLYAGWEARRYSPSGELAGRVRFPVSNITKIALGGDDQRTAFATTARQLLGPEETARQPQAGDLFSFSVEVPGLPCFTVED